MSRFGVGISASAVAGALLLSGSAQAAGAALLRHADLQADSSSAVLTLSLSEPVAAHVFRLHDPERVVVDLPRTRPLASLPTPETGGAIRVLRSGYTPQRALRLVLELQSPMRLQRAAIRAEDWQLRIELRSGAPILARSPAGTSVHVNAAPAAGMRLPADATNDSEPASAVRALHAPSGAERPVVIAVDAGHGGDDPGASGAYGTHEKDVTLAIARALAARIDREPGLRAVLTRDGDYFVELVDRRRRAQRAHADMFVSIHADAIRDRDVAGASVYILSERGATSQAAKILAEEQNAADLKGGISLAAQQRDLRPVLLDLSQSASMAESAEAADRVLNSLDRVGAIRKHEVQQAAFVVLKSPDIPSMLVETAYISNPSEERLLRTPAQQARLADAICNGVAGYFRKNPPEGSLFSRNHEQASALTQPIARDGG